MSNRKSKRFAPNWLEAFTVIELMVVISVISLLLAMLVPSLYHAKKFAQQTVCTTRLHQWGLAFQTYATENNGSYPHIDGRDRTSSNPGTPAEIADYYFGWVDVLPPLMGQKPWREHPFWHKPGPKTIFQCPAAQLASDGGYKYRPQRTGYFSYAMNSCLELDENCWPPHGYQGSGWRMPSFLKTAAIKSPGRLVLLFDQLLDPWKGYNGKRYDGSAGKYCGSYPKAFAARHAKPRRTLGGNILYCDYHVAWTESVWKDHWPEDLEVPPYGDLDWYP